MEEYDKIERLIHAQLRGDIEVWDLNELLQWINQSPENKKQYELIKEYWQHSMWQPSVSSTALDEAYKRVLGQDFSDQKQVNNQFFLSTKKKPLTRWWSVAAAVVAVLLLSGLVLNRIVPFNQLLSTPDNGFKPLVVKKNPLTQKSNFRLPDGSEVWLNAGSELSYEQNFEGETRHVHLSGEGFFSVKKDVNKPFIVETDDFTVTALGTAFNIRSYKEEDKHAVALLSGKVEVDPTKTNHQQVVLNPGQGLVFDTQQKDFSDYVFDPEEVTGWKNSVLVFRGDDLKTVISKIRNWYGVEVTVEGTPPADFIVSGRFHNEYLSNVLRNLQYAREFEYEITNKSVKINF